MGDFVEHTPSMCRIGVYHMMKANSNVLDCS
jgi:hypothetical protein